MDRKIPKEEQRKKMALRLLKIAGAVVAVVLSVVIVVSLSRASVNINHLQICTVTRGSIETSVTASGEVMPAFEEIINSPIASRIIEVYKQTGDTVSRGSALLRLDLESTQNEYYSLLDEKEIRQHQLQQLRLNIATTLDNQRMNIAIAELEFERLNTELRNERYLDGIGSGTADRVRQAELSVSTAEKRLQQQRSQLANDTKIKQSELRIKELDYNIFVKKLDAMRRTLDDARIESPRGATITFINNQIGARVGAGEKIAVISDLTNYKVVAQTADAMVHYVKIGKRVVVKVGDDELKGVISNASPVSENGVIKFDVALEDCAHPRLRQGLRTDVYIMNEIHDNVLRIYNRSFYIGKGDYQLFVKNGSGELVRRNVRLGASNYDYVEVEEGLFEGDEVVVSDMRSYIHNNRITLKE
ncbi:MAG: HlyD family efflux transporter periplasmic adaptor subunit [Bacteroidaceae bacterium]|nr:HlyD family efflux transporter periplasmic adaptor subunit [Bacteroidaceae bacterium]